ncbi:amino acid adenylation domain-containing protein [Frankia sp. Cr2]|uniref:non-ribosomal peptide synthetase n=1 Tax=Frankia sp. Cr2 TaxID=3073932 RepID=UPI002AD37EC0|nr:amino acid adenylation domain-containing protein [Frankia sp. Cr2]
MVSGTVHQPAPGTARRPAGEVERHPLSAVQHAMLLHSISAPGEGVYLLQKVLTLHERLNTAMFEQALRQLFEWHPMLRTSLLLDHPEGPSQVVHSDVGLTLHKQDWRQFDSATRQRRLRAYLTGDRCRVFDFTAGPPMRFAVFCCGDDEYEFVWTTHHALMDGRSLFMVVAELFDVYDHLCAGRRADLPRRRPYRDYVSWLVEQDVAVAESFWRGALAGITAPTPLGVDTVRVPGPDEDVLAATGTELSEDTTAALELLAREQQVTANNVVQAAWGILLQQLSGCHDVVFGTTRAGRGFFGGAQEMIGLFLNTVPFRVTAPGTMTVIDLLKRLRRQQLALRGFEHTSPIRIHAWSDIPARLPLFESAVIFENHLPGVRLRALGGSWQHREFRLEERTNYPLTLYANHDRRLVLKIGYDRRRFSDGAAARMLGHLRRLLETMVSAPDVTLGGLPTLVLAELTEVRERTADRARRLMSVDPLDLPYRDLAAGLPERYRDIRFVHPAGAGDAPVADAARPQDARPCPFSRTLSPPGEHRQAGAERSRDGFPWLLTVLLCFLTRLVGEEGLDVELSWGSGPGPGDGTASRLPFRVPALSESRSVTELRDMVARQLELMDAWGPDRRDLGISNAQWHAQAPWVEVGLPVAVELVDHLDAVAEPRPATVLLVQIPRDGAGCRWLVAEDVLIPGATEAMRAMFVAFMRALADSPDADVTKIPLLLPEDRQRVLVTWNDTDADYPRASCAHQLFMAQARRRPEAPAVTCSDRVLTYGELDRRSTRLALFLGRHGVGPGALVGIYLERSEEIVVAVLGVMKSGAAFVPLDPVYPPVRVAQMIINSGLSLLLTQTSLEPHVQDCQVTVVPLDRSWEMIETHGSGTDDAGHDHAGHNDGGHDDAGTESYDRASPDGRVYVIFTSGSTGRPKGVAIRHSALTNLLCSMARTPGFTDHDRLLAVTTVCFDIAYLELLLPLVTGGQVEVVPADVADDGFGLRSRLEGSRPTVMQATPATWRMLIAAGWDGDRGLTALCGGEPLPRDLADGLLARAGKVWNLYGPTETTIWSSVDLVEPTRFVADPGSGHRPGTFGQVTSGQVTIGRPIANTRFYVLDRWMQPVPPGVPGELYIGGDGVAAGYLGEPELTRARFIPDPFRPDGSAVMYRTGDVVRHLPDGRLDYRHRVDNQVKLHGYRIELEEIEVALRRHDAIAEAVVCLREDTSGNRMLVAYLVPAGNGSDVRSAHLRRYLRALLPPYMVPAVFVTVTSLPLTANGKVDRRSLPRPAEAAAVGNAGSATPRTEVEAAIAGIWRSILGVPEVGIDENFFDAGGNSLLLMEILIRLRAELSESLTRVDMFAYPTVRQLASYLSASASASASATRSAAPDRPGRPERSGRLDRSVLAERRQQRGELRSRRPPGT